MAAKAGGTKSSADAWAAAGCVTAANTDERGVVALVSRAKGVGIILRCLSSGLCMGAGEGELGRTLAAYDAIDEDAETNILAPVTPLHFCQARTHIEDFLASSLWSRSLFLFQLLMGVELDAALDTARSLRTTPAETCTATPPRGETVDAVAVFNVRRGPRSDGATPRRRGAEQGRSLTLMLVVSRAVVRAFEYLQEGGTDDGGPWLELFVSAARHAVLLLEVLLLIRFLIRGREGGREPTHLSGTRRSEAHSSLLYATILRVLHAYECAICCVARRRSGDTARTWMQRSTTVLRTLLTKLLACDAKLMNIFMNGSMGVSATPQKCFTASQGGLLTPMVTLLLRTMMLTKWVSGSHGNFPLLRVLNPNLRLRKRKEWQGVFMQMFLWWMALPIGSFRLWRDTLRRIAVHAFPAVPQPLTSPPLTLTLSLSFSSAWPEEAVDGTAPPLASAADIAWSASELHGCQREMDIDATEILLGLLTEEAADCATNHETEASVVYQHCLLAGLDEAGHFCRKQRTTSMLCDAYLPLPLNIKKTPAHAELTPPHEALRLRRLSESCASSVMTQFPWKRRVQQRRESPRLSLENSTEIDSVSPCWNCISPSFAHTSDNAELGSCSGRTCGVLTENSSVDDSMEHYDHPPALACSAPACSSDEVRGLGESLTDALSLSVCDIRKRGPNSVKPPALTLPLPGELYSSLST
ncbi:uncharacterized protein Tco025E_02048 [Trypanosoma conorhini]|uniref:Uncharacterized protein n=1 Tax=Trypanosoma conorhini TaxID=83891 RepID=A0A422Q6T4_9TRYP|nr:uncharacterized protein Tco025E_02048 [Trypanosoma conorhini]RNF25666.1 hypothetical protein Tco025E_02048 [Trypanosoma conorhini]